MALKALLDSVEGLDESIQKEYKKDEKSGKYILDVEAVDGLALENVSGLKTALQKERGERSKLADMLKKFEGIEDPDAAREALEKYEEVKNWAPDKKVEEMLDARTKDLVKKHQKEFEKKDNEAKALRQQLEQVLISEAAMKAITAAKGSPTLLLPHVKQAARLREADGKYLVEVIDETGTVKVDNNGNPMTIQQFVEDLKSSDDFARAFEPSGSSGSGSGGSSSRQTANPGGKRTVKSSDQEAINANWEAIAKGEVVVVD